MHRALLLGIALLLALPGTCPAARAGVPAEGAAPPAPPAEEPPAPPPLTLEEADLLLQRAEGNLVLHGLSLDPRFLERAVGDYRTVTSRMPPEAGGDRRFTAHFALAFALARADLPEAGKAREAAGAEILRHMEIAARLEPGFPGLWVLDGLVREQTGDHAAAVESLKRGLADVESFEGLAPWQGFQLRFFGLLARARSLMDPAVGREDLAAKDAEEAMGLVTVALRDPRTPRDSRLRRVVLTHLAAAKQRLEHFAEAERILEELMKEDPGNPVHPYNLALVLAQQQRYGPALDLYRRSAALDPRDPRPHLKIAYILLVHPSPGGEPDAAGAEKAAEVFLALVGEPTEEYCALRGEAAFVRGDRRVAEAWFRRSLSREPDCRHSLNRMVQILGGDDAPTPARLEELETLRKRLTEVTRRRQKGKGMETEKPTLTFC